MRNSAVKNKSAAEKMYTDRSGNTQRQGINEPKGKENFKMINIKNATLEQANGDYVSNITQLTTEKNSLLR